VLPAASDLVLEPRKDRAILTNLVVPKTGGMNTTKVNVVQWLKREGDALKQGDAVVELETEKVNYELNSPVVGVLLKIVVREPAVVPVGGLLAYIGQAGDVAPAL
jgi:pyruvate/2-oxoglutarate dehydrogenase complex dihydrolipoamide acyltransferase (E2) component